MSNFAALQIPPQMRPELAKHIAETMCWAPAESSIVAFTALSVLYASWHVDDSLTVPELLEQMEAVFKQAPEQVLQCLTDASTYAEQGVKHEVGTLTTYHTQQSLKFWLQRVKAPEVTEHMAVVLGTFNAALNDDSDRAQIISGAIVEAIAAMTPEARDGSAASQGLLIAGPHGPLGPFTDMQQARQYLREYMRAHLTGQPPPPLPGQDPSAEMEEPVPAGPGTFLYSRKDAVSFVQKLPPPMPNEGNMEQRRLLESMANSNGWRSLTILPEGDPLAVMYQRFPHFKEPLDCIAESLALAGCGSEGRVVRIPPILLRGVQGTGKSYFAKELARVLGTHYVEKDLSIMSEAFVIAGHSSSWKGSKPGVVFDALVQGKTANPLICLNEIDKASPRGTQNSPIAPLYTLLEYESAVQFEDEFVPIAIDASRINWVCTANDGDIPAPILERLEVFEIKEPTKEQCRQIAVSVWHSICETVLPKGHGFSTELGDTLLDVMSAMRPRVMRKTLRKAAGRAALKGNKFLTIEDLSASQKRYEAAPVRSIGFTADA
jgi:ATP-dependent Lon protease